MESKSIWNAPEAEEIRIALRILCQSRFLRAPLGTQRFCVIFSWVMHRLTQRRKGRRGNTEKFALRRGLGAGVARRLESWG